jgi:hypothetical protein
MAWKTDAWRRLPDLQLTAHDFPATGPEGGCLLFEELLTQRAGEEIAVGTEIESKVGRL